MKHDIELLNDFVDGTLGTEEEQHVEQHLVECDSCRKELESIRSLKKKTAALSPTILPKRDLWSGIESRISPRKESVIVPFNRGTNQSHVPDSPTRWLRYTLAAAAILAFAVIGVVWVRYYASPAWKMEIVDSSSSRSVTTQEQLRIGEVLQTNSSTRATIQVGTIGYVNVEPNSTIRLVEATVTDHRLALEKGTIRATIFAPPRLFFVQTPSALAVDLGCAYTMTVDESGGTILQVTTGWVSLEFGGRESIVPAGAMCATRPGFGPGTPFQQDASPELQQALVKYDFGLADSASLSVILQQARNMDSITLWHLLFRTTGEERARVYDRLAFLVPPPKGVTRSGMLEGNPEMLSRWQKYLNLGNSPWWKFWSSN